MRNYHEFNDILTLYYMACDIQTEERIDDFLRGRMSEEEKCAFEKDLATNPELKKNFDFQWDLSLCSQIIGLRDFISDRINQVSKKSLLIKRFVYGISIAASFIIIITGTTLHAKLSKSLKGAFLSAYEETQAPQYPKNDEIGCLLLAAYNYIGEGKLDIAQEHLDTARKKIHEEAISVVFRKKHIMRLEQEISRHEQDRQWYSALIQVQRGNVIKASLALRNIAKNGGTYSSLADGLIKEVYKSAEEKKL